MPQSTRPFDLIALDLDGTIMDRRFPGGFSPRVRNAIRRAQEAGVLVTIATGRTLDYVAPRAVDLGVTIPVVTTQGAVVGDPVTRRILYEALMPMDAARQVVAWAEENDRVLILYFSDGQGGTVMVQNRERWTPSEYDYWFGAPRRVEPNLFRWLEGEGAHPPLKFITISHVAEEPDLTRRLQELLGPSVHISRTHDQLVEGTAAGVDKGNGLLHLLQELHIPRARVLAIGDNENDIPLLRTAGFGVAMGQASEHVKAVADWVAPTIDEEGAAVTIERFVLRTV